MSENKEVHDYLPIRVSTLRGEQKIDFNAYVKINDKHILYVRKGDSFEGERLTRLKSKKLKKMFILPEEEALYRTYLARNIELAYDKNSTASMQTRAEIVQGTQQTNAEAVMENPENEYIYNDAKETALKFAQFLSSEEDSFKAVLNIANTDQSISHHGVTVATLANGLAKKLGITDTKQLQMLTLGSLLHDFEHFHSGLLINRPLADFTEAEKKTYFQHPSLGAEKVADKKHFDKTVLNIILQHEEYIDGKGYPHGLPESRQDPLSVIVSSANALDRLIAFEGVDKNDATKKLMVEHVGKHPLNHIQFLGELLKQAK